MVKKWFTEFRCGRTSTIDAERSGRPVEVAIPEIIENIRNMVLADRRLKVREIVEAIGISHGSVVSIWKDHLGMKKLSFAFFCGRTFSKSERAYCLLSMMYNTFYIIREPLSHPNRNVQFHAKGRTILNFIDDINLTFLNGVSPTWRTLNESFGSDHCAIELCILLSPAAKHVTEIVPKHIPKQILNKRVWQILHNQAFIQCESSKKLDPFSELFIFTPCDQKNAKSREKFVKK